MAFFPMLAKAILRRSAGRALAGLAIISLCIVSGSRRAAAAGTWQPRVDTHNLRDTVTVQVVRHCSPAIVSITAKRLITRQINPFGGVFWGPVAGGPFVQMPADFLGSGFIIQKEGYVVTNNHVVDQARAISVTLSNGKSYKAHVVGSDPQADLAILKIDRKKTFPTIPLGSSADLMIGEPCIAVGNPFGFSQSVSSGIVSALHREIHEPKNPVPLKNLIQTDAAINPGNSGGPLLNVYGQVVGINTAIRGNAQNIGFAIGVDRLASLLPELLNPAMARGLNIPINFVDQRTLRQPADIQEKVQISGIPDSTIRSIDGRRIHTLIGACAALLATAPGQKTVKVLLVNGKMLSYPILAVPPSPVVIDARKKLGITIEQMTPLMAGKYHFKVQSGIFIKAVKAGSIGALAGLKPQDVLVKLGPYPIRTLHDLGILLPHLPKTGRVQVLVVRNGGLGVGYLVFP